MTQSFFEKRIKGLLQYVGAIGAALMGVVYIIVVIVLIQGFNNIMDIRNTMIFAVINAIIGLIIMQLLKAQGITFAKNIPENRAIIDQYYNTDTKDKKPRSIKFYWVTTAIKDIFIKGASLMVSTFGVIYLVIQGSHDYHLILLALSNLIMFICFGLLALNSAYDFYNERHIPYIIKALKEAQDDQTSGRSGTPESTGTSPEKQV